MRQFIGDTTATVFDRDSKFFRAVRLVSVSRYYLAISIQTCLYWKEQRSPRELRGAKRPKKMDAAVQFWDPLLKSVYPPLLLRILWGDKISLLLIKLALHSISNAGSRGSGYCISKKSCLFLLVGLPWNSRMIIHPFRHYRGRDFQSMPLQSFKLIWSSFISLCWFSPL